ncbi:unnamed protein product [Larinioides sclopetarius]|uniref:Uncharacterized protein n=1 Tax=Larinioides sclopetarius TaxID=280406 RepID=A0AAV2A9M7_9ARAC
MEQNCERSEIFFREKGNTRKTAKKFQNLKRKVKLLLLLFYKRSLVAVFCRVLPKFSFTFLAARDIRKLKWNEARSRNETKRKKKYLE